MTGTAWVVACQSESALISAFPYPRVNCRHAARGKFSVKAAARTALRSNRICGGGSVRTRASVEDFGRMYQVTANVNPDPHAEGFTPQPISSVTAIIDELDDLVAVLESLQQSGFSAEQVSVFMGAQGLAKLDLHGEKHGILARTLRALESLAGEDQANQDAEAALKEGRIFVVVLTDGGENQKSTVERLLKEHNARMLRFFGRWTVEHL
jgi:hypothetical protein